MIASISICLWMTHGDLLQTSFLRVLATDYYYSNSNGIADRHHWRYPRHVALEV